jgi:hypothetical protein
LKKVGAEYAGKVDVWKINADEQPNVLRSLRIFGIPTLVAFHDGQEVTRLTGVASATALASLFEAALSNVEPVNSGPALIERLVRVLAGLVLLGLAFMGKFSGLYLVLALLGGVILFSAVYDRCPFYQAIATRLKALSGREPTHPSQT